VIKNDWIEKRRGKRMKVRKRMTGSAAPSRMEESGQEAFFLYLG
jgi:hypothetical protein